MNSDQKQSSKFDACIPSNWDERFTDLAQFVAEWSKDPSTKVGAVIVNDQRQVLSLGYNGFPRGVFDLESRYSDRDQKLKFVAHAERNALDNAFSDVRGATLYTTLCPCNECAKSIIQRGIRRVVAHKFTDLVQRERFNAEITEQMFHEAGVALDLI